MANPPQGFGVGATVSSAEIEDDSIVNSDINTGALILFSKLENLDSAKMLVGDASNVPAEVSVTGDVTISNSGVTTIGSGKVTEAMQVIADNTTNNVSTSAHGYVPKVPNNTTTFLRGDGTFSEPSGGGAIKLIASGTASTTSTSVTNIVDISIASADFGNNDLCLVIVAGDTSAGSGGFKTSTRVDDSTNTVDVNNNNSGFDNDTSQTFIELLPGSATTVLMCSDMIGNTEDNVVNGTVVSNFISGAWTLILRGFTVGAGTLSIRYKVLKISQ